MTKQKTKKHTQIVFESLKAAAGSKRWTMRVLQAAKAAACPAFRGNRIYGDELDTWLAAHPEIKKLRKADDLKGSKLREEIRKLKLANDLKEGRLIERANVIAKFHEYGGALDAYRLKSEAEHPLLFAAAAGDVPACRAVMQKIWDDLMAAKSEMLGKAFDE